MLLAMEWSRTHGQRGLVASWPQFGVPCGLLLSNLAVLAFSAWSGDQFMVWGWRIPFALSIIQIIDEIKRVFDLMDLSFFCRRDFGGTVVPVALLFPMLLWLAARCQCRQEVSDTDCSGQPD